MTTLTCSCFEGERSEKSFGHFVDCPLYQPTTTTNEAAERLRSEQSFDSGLTYLLDEALAAERRATVERIRERLLLDEGEPVPESYASRVLDEEAARV